MMENKTIIGRPKLMKNSKNIMIVLEKKQYDKIKEKIDIPISRYIRECLDFCLNNQKYNDLIQDGNLNYEKIKNLILENKELRKKNHLLNKKSTSYEIKKDMAIKSIISLFQTRINNGFDLSKINDVQNIKLLINIKSEWKKYFLNSNDVLNFIKENINTYKLD